MTVKKIDAALLKKMFIGAASALESKKEIINELNVFPVPDGDTGTNMSMTIMSAVNEVNKLDDNPSMEDLAKAISSGSLRGARGNSGVILSQLIRGFTKVIKDEKYIDVDVAVNAFQRGVETAYKAVMKPKEGTILTVARSGADRAAELLGSTSDLCVFFKKVLDTMQEVLDYTPELLPVLKEAGVVDSGGRGLLETLKGAYDVLCGKNVDTSAAQKKSEGTSAAPRTVSSENISTSDIKFGYCTEFIILLEKEFTEKDEEKFKAYLESIGDSIVCVADDDVVKIHVHTNDPGLAIQRALKYGQLSRMKIDNMREEHNEKLNLEAEKAKAGTSSEAGNSSSNGDSKDGAGISSVNEAAGASGDDKAKASGNNSVDGDEKADASGKNSGSQNGAPSVIKRLMDIPDEQIKNPEPSKENAFVAVSVGDGINEIFRGLGVDYLIEGGQTMNPSTEDMLNAIEAVDAKNIFILPNNKNIILAAEQAKELTEDRNVVVIPSKTVPQGITAMINFLNGRTPEENEAAMTESMANIKTGQITYSVRDTKIDGLEIKMGDFMGIDDHSIKSTGSDVVAVSTELLETMIDDESELVSIYYGVDGSEEEAQKIADAISEKYDMVDVEVHAGDQPVYYYIVSVE